MKFILSVALVFIAYFAHGQNGKMIFYVNEFHDYSLLVDGNAKVRKQNIEKGYMETFVFNEDGKFKFAISLAKTSNDSIINDSVDADLYIQSYLNNCGCTKLSSEKRVYRNINTIQLKIQREEAGRKLIGYSDFFTKGKYLFNVLYMTVDNNFETYEDEYFKIMNTLVVNSALE